MVTPEEIYRQREKDIIQCENRCRGFRGFALFFLVVALIFGVLLWYHLHSGGYVLIEILIIVAMLILASTFWYFSYTEQEKLATLRCPQAKV